MNLFIKLLLVEMSNKLTDRATTYKSPIYISAVICKLSGALFIKPTDECLLSLIKVPY